MKTATLPPVRIAPQSRDDIEQPLGDGETLTALVETAWRDEIARRREQAEFVKRGLLAIERTETAGMACRLPRCGPSWRPSASKRRGAHELRGHLQPRSCSGSWAAVGPPAGAGTEQPERDLGLPERALHALRVACGFLARSPFSCRKVGHGALVRELVIDFGRL